MAAIDDKMIVISEADIAFFESLKAVDTQFAREILKIYAKFAIGRDLALDVEELAQLEESLIAAVAKTNYKLSVNAYIPNFEVIQALNIEMHEQINGINATDVFIESDKIKNFQAIIESRLRGTPSTIIQVTDIVDGETVIRNLPIRNSSLNELLDPIADIIRRDVITGVSFESATENILAAIDDKDIGLEQWADQIARDALSQADGITQDEIRKEFDLKFFRYVGTIRKGTRPFCYAMLTRKESPVFNESELDRMLQEFIPGGVPNPKRVTTHSGRSTTKGSGMIPGTDDGTFFMWRGGYNCHHQAVPTKIK